MSWKNIVVGIDGSEQSENALKAAIDLAKGINAHIQITAVYTNPTMLGFLPPYAPQVPKEVVATLEQMVKKYSDFCRREGWQDVSSKVLASWSTPGGALIAEAEKLEKSVIVVGARGVTGLKRTLLGSVAEYVAKNSDCDVIIIK